MKGHDVVKKFLSLLLCLGLLVSIGVSATAAQVSADGTLNERLKAITLSVKNTLGIGDAFTSFNGTLNENERASLWSLTWSKDNEQIYVSANENGRIVSYNNYVSGNNTPIYSHIPRFPAITIDEAKTVAMTFLGKVLNTKLEAVDLQGNSNLDYSGSAMFYLNGNLKLNGIESPINISLNVSAATKQVTNFYRSDMGQDYSGVSNPLAATDKTAAAAALKETLNMKMTYALPGDGTHTARLQYTPNPAGSYVVDAVTGKLVDLSKLDYTSSSSNPQMTMDAPSASAAPGGSSLTTVEQGTVDKLQGVLSQSDLENKIRAYQELGLTSEFKLQYVNYYTYEDENKQTQVMANIGLTYTPKDDTAQYRYITMDGKTGKLISVSSNRIYTDAKTPATVFKYSSDQTEAVARSFAGKILPEEMKQTALSKDTAGVSYPDSTQNYAFYRTHDSIFFPENYIHVGVDAETGYVVSFYSNWYTYDVTFISPAGAISAAAAADKYAVGTGIALKYVDVPTSTHASGLLLSYSSADTTVWGVNSITGELLKTAVVTDSGLKYSDIDGHPNASMIRQLAAFGIGFPGGVFKPDAQLTQEDALILIESTNGRKVMPLTTPGSVDDLYNIAYSMGILTEAERDPQKRISRAEFAKYLINALGYGEVARLSGIYKAGFGDDASIPANLVGYVAIAKGLGIIKGDQNNQFKPNDTANRTMAAIMLYNCMSRK